MANISAESSKTRATLLERLQDGTDILAWDEFFQRYWRLIYAYARRCNCDEHTAEEIVQDVMLKVFEQKDVFRYDPRRGRFRDWLCTVVRNKVAEYRRRPAQRIQARGGSSAIKMMAAHPENDEQPADVWENAFEQSLLLLILDVVRREMSSRAYLAFELFTIHEMPGATVAKQTGLTRNGVYRASKKAIERLKELGIEYKEKGQLGQKIKDALKSSPPSNVERSMTVKSEERVLTDD